jgi:hypothetical protein
VKERARVSGKTSLTRLSVEEAVEALGVEADVLRERIKSNTVPHELDEHGRVYLLVGASSNIPDPDHNLCRTPRDQEITDDLETQTSDLRSATEPPEGPGEPTKPFEGTRPPGQLDS